MEAKPKKPAASKSKKEAKEQKVEETTSSDYFATTTKPKFSRSTPVRPKAAAPAETPTKSTNGATPSSARRSGRKSAAKSYAEDDGEVSLLKDDGGGHDDIAADEYKHTGRKGRDDYEADTDDEVIKPAVRKSTNARVKKAESEDDDNDIEMAELPAYDGPGDAKTKRTTAPAGSGRKRKSKDLEEDENGNFLDDDEDTPKKKSRKTASKPAAPKKPRASTKKAEEPENTEVQAILDSIQTVRPPTPPARDSDEKPKFKFGGGNTGAVPVGAGTKEIPEGAENCLSGLKFVFTGVLETLQREVGQNLVKRYGGQIMSAPSKNTSYVVLGTDAGPKKLETIAKLAIKTINEDGLFELIRKMPPNGGDGKAAAAWAEKKAKEEEKIRKEAEEMEQREKEREKEAAKVAKAKATKAGGNAPAPRPPKSKTDDMLWVDKYAPDSLTAVCGNKGLVEKLQKWLRNWHNNAKYNFKKAGADGSGVYRAAMLHGPPGIGKTTAAHLVANLEGFDVIESNASDTRSKKLVETGLTGVLDTTSIMGFFAGDGKKVDTAKKKIVLIMDEVDGMSAGDRGGVGAMAAVAKKTKIPLILICNERRLPKMKPFDFICADFAFRRPTTDMIRGRIMTICYREGIKMPTPVIDALIEGSHADIRQIINMISTVKLDNRDIDFNDSKAMSKAWEKHVILKPWDVVSKILRPQMFASSSTATLNDKIELYFNDHEFSYLMLQENYLKTQPSLASSYSGKQQNLKLLELADNAASSISDGDLVDRMIHGSQQQWSLMPTHAVFSFVKPASYSYGNFNARVQFAEWLGQNSKYGKLTRYIKEIQGHMRLKTSGDRHEVRQQYLPALWQNTVAKLQGDDSKDMVQEVIDFMDQYYLTREDFDAIMELGVGPMNDEKVKIESQTKATFTRLYNQQSHPMPFVKATNVLGVSKGAGKKEKPDLEEAVDESDADDGLLDADAKEEGEDDELDLKKDKYVKVPKKKAAPKAKADAKGKGKRKKADQEDDDDDEEEDVKPKKKSAAGGARGGRKAKAKA